MREPEIYQKHFGIGKIEIKVELEFKFPRKAFAMLHSQLIEKGALKVFKTLNVKIVINCEVLVLKNIGY